MATKSDPARDFTDLCTKLRNTPTQGAGGTTLAAVFDVEEWSTEFMLILASLHQRIEALKKMIAETDLDDDIKVTAFERLENIRLAFKLNGLSNQWENTVKNYLNDASLTPIRMTSGYLRINYGYFVPDSEELEEIVSDVAALLEWLMEANLSDRDFIRTALIDGLEAFLFRMRRVGSFGWPDTFESLKAVIAAYMALERGMPEANVSPPYEAAMKKTREVLESLFNRVKFAKDVTETGDWLLRGYVAIQAVGHVQPAIAGLLTYAAK